MFSQQRNSPPSLEPNGIDIKIKVSPPQLNDIDIKIKLSEKALIKCLPYVLSTVVIVGSGWLAYSHFFI